MSEIDKNLSILEKHLRNFNRQKIYFIFGVILLKFDHFFFISKPQRNLEPHSGGQEPEPGSVILR